MKTSDIKPFQRVDVHCGYRYIVVLNFNDNTDLKEGRI